MHRQSPAEQDPPRQLRTEAAKQMNPVIVRSCLNCEQEEKR